MSLLGQLLQVPAESQRSLRLSVEDGVRGCFDGVEMIGAAGFSSDRRYRYILSRSWKRPGDRGHVAFILSYPGKADAGELDPITARCVDFALRWGFAKLAVVNLFGLRTTEARMLYELDAAGDDPVGPENDAAIFLAALATDLVVCAWGVHGLLRGRGAQVAAMLRANVNVRPKLVHLGLTSDGPPRHPLEVRRDVRLVRWE